MERTDELSMGAKQHRIYNQQKELTMSRMGLCGAMAMVLLAGLRVDASPQIPEEINYGGRILEMHSKPLEAFFTKDNPKPAFGTAHSSACNRGYIGTWNVEEGSLWLASLADVTGEPVPPDAVNKTWAYPVKATWYTGNLLVDNKIIQVKEGNIVGGHEADSEHPLAVRIEADSLTADNITSAVISRMTEGKTGEGKCIPREKLDGLLKTMETGKATDSSGNIKDGYFITLERGAFGCIGAIYFSITDDGRGMYIVDGFGFGFESKALAEMLKRIYDSP